MLDHVYNFYAKQFGNLPTAPECDAIEERLQEMARLFVLTPEEISLVHFAFLYSCNSAVEASYDHISTQRHRQPHEMVKLLPTILGITPLQMLKISRSDGRLRQCSILSDNLALEENLVEYLAGTGSSALAEEYLKPDSGTTLPLERLSITEHELQMLRHICTNATAERGVNILFYGTPGTGKTELARALAKEMGRSAYFLLSNPESHRSNSRNQGIVLAETVLTPARHLLIVDEADDLLNSGNGLAVMLGLMPDFGKKGETNELLDGSKLVRIWITNYSRMIDESTRRRFDYAIEFRPYSESQRKRVWETLLERNPAAAAVLPREGLDLLAEEFPLQAGSMERALRWIAPEQSPAENLERVRSILRSQGKLLEVRCAAPATRANSVAYSLEGLVVVGDPLERIVGSLKRFTTERPAGIRNISVLLQGPPGTGKTEYARHIARELQLPLTVRKASDLLGKYVGESEKLIAEAFADAQRQGTVLFIDEADSLLAKRDQAHHQWEVTQVNELLTQMEQFEGIFLCATNFASQLDVASLRRFTFKVEFCPLEESGIRLFFDRYLGDLVSGPLSHEEERELARLRGLCPGDFKVVRQKRQLLESEPVAATLLLADLLREVESRDPSRVRKMGFGR
jgi:SpoVK/Ycf46/Vps4 family AAA+-type ATPase